jgi:DNA polymerase-4
VGLPITVGVATTKFLAKVASAVAKPDGLLVVAPGAERAFLEPLPVEALWGVGPATAARLRARGLATVGDVARLDQEALVAILGTAAGRHLHCLAHNRDPRPVRAGRRRRSVGSQCALDFSSRPPGEIDRTLVALVDRVTRRMRRSGHAGRTVILRLRFGDYTRASRSRTLPDATAATRAVLATARELLEEARPMIERRGLTLLGVAVSNLGGGGPVQLPLPLDGARGDALDAAMDRVRDRFGTESVTRASLSGGHRALAPWLMPE